jgi:hypothetical protein
MDISPGFLFWQWKYGYGRTILFFVSEMPKYRFLRYGSEACPPG